MRSLGVFPGRTPGLVSWVHLLVVLCGGPVGVPWEASSVFLMGFPVLSTAGSLEKSPGGVLLRVPCGNHLGFPFGNSLGGFLG